MNLDMTKLEPLIGTMVNEIGAAANGALVLLGEKLGLYQALAAGGAQTSSELAERTGTHERYLREWLSAQAASGFVTYDSRAEKFLLSPEQLAVLADEESPFYMTGGFFSLAALFAGESKLAQAFRTGEGIGWGEQCNCLFCGVERFFRPGYKANLAAQWLPSLDGVAGKLERGAKVADVGCGHGASTLIMAKAYPNTKFVGIDFHEASIAQAKERANGADNIRFICARAQDFPGSDYDLITMFDALHDVGDPIGAAAHALSALKADGTLMLVEPKAGDSLAENLNPVGRVYYAFSASVCVPTSLNQEVGAALGAQAGEKRLAEVLRAGGFSRIRRAAETPFNMVLEARP